jgi:hypothetical protein
VCTENVARRRIEQGRRHPAKNRTVELYRKIREEFEEIMEPKLVVDTGGAMEVPLAEARVYLAS